MPLYEFTKEEIEAVKNKFPSLDLARPGVWEGNIDFYSEYEGHSIRDGYKIAITASSEYPIELPSVIEIGGRTQAIATKYKIKEIRDLHLNPLSKAACLCVKQEEKIKFPPGSDLVVFIENLVIPYFYSLSYFNEKGRWPWGEYSHGGLGLLEFYAEDPTGQTKESIEETAKAFRADNNWKEYHKQLRKPSGDKICPCGFRKPFRKCHGRAWQGLLRLNSDLKRLNLNVNSLYRR